MTKRSWIFSGAIRGSLRAGLNVILLLACMMFALAGFLFGMFQPLGFGAAVALAAGLLVWILFHHGAWILQDLQAQPVLRKDAPEIYSLLERLSQRAGMPVPQLYGIASASANIFSVHGRVRPAIALTLGGAEHLNREELEGILAHELVKVQRGDTLFAGLAVTVLKGVRVPIKILRAFFSFGNAAQNHEPDNPLVAALSCLILPLEGLLLAWVRRGISQTALDAKAAGLSDPLYLASALRRLETQTLRFPFRRFDRIYGPLFILWPGEVKARGWKGLWDTHPPVFKRILSLERIPCSVAAAGWLDQSGHMAGAVLEDPLKTAIKK